MTTAYLEVVQQNFRVFQSVVLFKSEHLPIKKSKTAETTTQTKKKKIVLSTDFNVMKIQPKQIVADLCSVVFTTVQLAVCLPGWLQGLRDS